MSDNGFEKCHCNGCGRETRHEILSRREVQTEELIEEYGPAENMDTYEMLQCQGCESICLRHSHLFVPNGDETISYYPPRVSRRFPRWRWDLPEAMRELLDEIYGALHSDSRRIAIMGVRTLVDMLALEHVGDVGSFDKKLAELERAGLIGASNREILQAAIDAGNAAAHRGYQPSVEHLNAAMDIVENLLQAVYHLKKLRDELRSNTPPRP